MHQLPNTYTFKVVERSEDELMLLLLEASLPKGLGFTNWQGDYWKIRTTLKDRIIFKFTDHISFLFLGSHAEIRGVMKGKS